MAKTIHSVRTLLKETTRRTRNAFEAHVWPGINFVMMLWPRRRTLRANKVTIIAVSYRSCDFLSIFLEALQLRWDDKIAEVIIVDNASRDGSRLLLKGKPWVRSVFLPVNIFHGPALDLAINLVKTEYFVTLDIDAFPIADGWLDVALEPLKQGFSVSGARYPLLTGQGGLDPYAHPSFLAMRTEHFRDHRHSFAAIRRKGRLIFDAGGAISAKEGAGAHLIRASSIRGPGDIGAVYEDSVFHLFGGTRTRVSANSQMQTLVVEARAAWSEALDCYLPDRPRDAA